MIRFIISFLALALLIALLTSCVYESYELPSLNDKHHYNVVISGFISPRTDLSLFVRATYAAYNAKCNINKNWFEGVKSRRVKNEFYKSNTMNYFIRIPIDKFSSGHCDWKISKIDFVIKNPLGYAPWLTAVTFGKHGTMPHTPGTLRCKNNLYTQCHGNDLQGFYTTKYVSRKKNYIFVQNIQE